MSGTIAFASRRVSTVTQELVVGVTGLLLIGFVIAHLSGNLLILVGPEAFNAYAHKLQSLGPLLWVARIGLIITFVLHISGAIGLALSNRAARKQGYAVQHSIGRRGPGTRTMTYTGLAVFFFLLLHLYDFTFADKTGPKSFLVQWPESSAYQYHGAASGEAGAGNFAPGRQESAELYGVVWNAFANPVHSFLYILAMIAVGLHMSHAASSVLVTLGVLKETGTTKAELIGKCLGVAVAGGFILIPLYVLARTYLGGGPA